MADDPTPVRQDRPVLTGIVALVGVALVVGMVLGGGALAATKVLGLGGGDRAADGATSTDTLFLPEFEETEKPSGPLLTLRPDPSKAADPKNGTTEKPAPKSKISLSAGQTQVVPMGQIDLTGIYPGGEGAILQVQRLEAGTWDEFPVTVAVSNETFSTYVQTGQVGANKFRVVDTDNGKTSNVVKVQIS